MGKTSQRIMYLLLCLLIMMPSAYCENNQSWISYFGAWATGNYDSGVVSESDMTPDLAWEYFIRGIDELNSEEPYWGLIRLNVVYDYIVEGNELPAFVSPYCKERFLSELAYYYGGNLHLSSFESMNSEYLSPRFQDSSDVFQLVFADKTVENWLYQNDIHMWFELLCYEGENQFRLERYNQAVKYLQKALKLLPELPQAEEYVSLFSSVWLSLVHAVNFSDHNFIFCSCTDEDASACLAFFQRGAITRAPSELTFEERRTYGNILLASGLYADAAEQLSLVVEEKAKLSSKKWAKARANCTKAKWLAGQISTQQAIVELFAVMQLCGTKYPDIYVDASYAQIQLFWHNGQFKEYMKAVEQLFNYAGAVDLQDETSREIVQRLQDENKALR